MRTLISRLRLWRDRQWIKWIKEMVEAVREMERIE